MAQRRRSCRKRRHPRHNLISYPRLGQPPYLLSDSRVQCGVARVQAGNILSFRIRPNHRRYNFLQRHAGSIYHLRALRGMRQHLIRHYRTRIQTHVARTNQPIGPQRQQIRRARAGTNKIHGHTTTTLLDLSHSRLLRGHPLGDRQRRLKRGKRTNPMLLRHTQPHQFTTIALFQLP